MEANNQTLLLLSAVLVALCGILIVGWRWSSSSPRASTKAVKTNTQDGFENPARELTPADVRAVATRTCKEIIFYLVLTLAGAAGLNWIAGKSTGPAATIFYVLAGLPLLAAFMFALMLVSIIIALKRALRDLPIHGNSPELFWHMHRELTGIPWR